MSNRKGTVAYVIGLFVSLILGLMVGSVVATAGKGATGKPTAADADTTSTTAPAKTKAPSIEDGVWTVGVDIPAGSYRTTANVSSRCYWQVTKSGGNSFADIVDNDMPGGGRPSVTLKKGQDFKTDNCGTWRKV